MDQLKQIRIIFLSHSAVFVSQLSLLLNLLKSTLCAAHCIKEVQTEDHWLDAITRSKGLRFKLQSNSETATGEEDKNKSSGIKRNGKCCKKIN